MSGLIRLTHPYGFRVGDWAELLGQVEHATTGHLCYAVRFPDGASDFWPVVDEMAGYEFAEEFDWPAFDEGYRQALGPVRHAFAANFDLCCTSPGCNLLPEEH